MRRRLIPLIVALSVSGAAIEGVLYWLNARLTEPGSASSQTSVVIPKGTSSQSIARLLQEAGVIDRPWVFLAGIQYLGKRGLQAGEYSFPPRASLASVLDLMHRGQVVVHKFTLAEGLTVFQVLAGLRQAQGLTGNVGAPPDEGRLMPETYHYSLGDSRESLINRMSHAMDELVDDAWPKRAPKLPLANKVDAVILASIVERETAIPEERPRVAAVFFNRLALHMKLQSDPTVIFAVSNGEGALDRALTRDDLAQKNPYNTYVTDGLPPGPICNPGRASLSAVLHPMTSDDLYFVADGAGGHVFAKTLAEHNRNVAKFRALQKNEATPSGEKGVKLAR